MESEFLQKKEKQTNSRSAAFRFSKNTSNGFYLEDNRPAAIAQRKLQEAIQNSPQIKRAIQLQSMFDNYTSKQPVIQKRSNNTGLPDNLKSGIENLSGYAMDDVKVHYNSSKPAQLNAHAYAQGTDIHLASGQEKHLPHEAWHVVQQKQGRVLPTMQMKGKELVNDDEKLEIEATEMGTKAIENSHNHSELDNNNSKKNSNISTSSTPIQREAWLYKNQDEERDPTLLTIVRATSVLKENGYDLDDRQKEALEIILDDSIKRYYDENNLSLKRLYDSIVALTEPIATVSYAYRYHDNYGRGALKYDPVGIGKSFRTPMNLEAIESIRDVRRKNEEDPQFNFETPIMPGSPSKGRKIMVVPSVGCPEFLKNKKAVMHLQWAVYASERPTVLLVPMSELDTYLSETGELMKKIDVGIVGWNSEDGLLGFGASRLAAQNFAFTSGGPRREVVMCDVNTTVSKEVRDGYETGEEYVETGVDNSLKNVKGDAKYSAAGKGTGVPWSEYDSEQDKLKERKASRGKSGRPIEQVVIVGATMLYDPSFITSSEDADLTNRLLTQEGPLHEEEVTAATFKQNTYIEKVDLGLRYLAGSYMEQRNKLLAMLAYEDRILINYNRSLGQKKMTPRIMTIGELAQEIVSEVYKLSDGESILDPTVIRSLIIEKIILEAKRRNLAAAAEEEEKEEEKEEEGGEPLHKRSRKAGNDE